VYWSLAAVWHLTDVNPFSSFQLCVVCCMTSAWFMQRMALLVFLGNNRQAVQNGRERRSPVVRICVHLAWIGDYTYMCFCRQQYNLIVVCSWKGTYPVTQAWKKVIASYGRVCGRPLSVAQTADCLAVELTANKITSDLTARTENGSTF